MKWRILGPVEAERVLLRRPQQRGVLGFLLLNANQIVTIEQLVEALWAGAAPSSARTQVHGCVSQIRQALRATASEGCLASQLGGYRIVVAEDELDLAVFTRRIGRARAAKTAGKLAEAAAEFKSGLALWRGAALTGAAGAFVAAASAGLNDERLAACEELFGIELVLGRHTALVPELQALVRAHPLREPLIAQLMLALAGCGHQAEALHLYTVTRERLADELGMAPSAELVAAHLRVLRQELPQRPATAPPQAADVTPAQLPADVAGFAGRATHLRRLDELLESDRDGPATVVISAIDGMAGIGKTSLAVHWGHRIAHRFPDGQLYANLRGFDPGRAPMAPAEGIRGFLDALHVPPQRIPADLDAQSALYRSLLAGKRMFILLDNARDAEQVRPLLPGTAGCLVIVTSRNRLTGLVAAVGAQPLTLDLLPTSEAVALLAGRLGQERVEAEPEAVRYFIERCGHLPLALAVVAARAATQPELPLAALARQLREAGSGLDGLRTDDPATDVRAVFSWSYHALSPRAARLFRLLGLHPGPDLSLAAAASLAGSPEADVRTTVAELTRAHLLTERASGRYVCHDLLRTYAMELATAAQDERREATLRLLDHYLHSALAADRRLDQHREPIAATPPRSGTSVAEFTAPDQALQWLTTEYRALLAAARHAAQSGFDTHAWQLPLALATFFDRQGLWLDWIDSYSAALDAAERLADPSAQARVHRDLARGHGKFGRHAQARTHLQHALQLFGDLGDGIAQAGTQLNLGGLCGQQGQYEQALRHARQALELFTSAGHRNGQAKALNNIGWYHAQLGLLREALEDAGKAQVLLNELGDRRSEADAWDSLGYAHLHLGEHVQSIACYQQALALYRDEADRYAEAATLHDLGDAHHSAGQPGLARQSWRLALSILQELGHPSAAQVAAKLATSG